MKKNLIGIDASRAVLATRRGVEHYSYKIINQLIKQYPKELFRLYTPYLPEDAWETSKQVEWRVIPAKRLWSQLQLAQEIRRDPPDILFVPSHVIPVLTNVKSIVTIHDLAYKYYPKSYSSFERRYLNFSTSSSASKATRIIVPSQSTKNDLIRFHQISESKISVIPHGYDTRTYNTVKDTDSPLKQPYFFYVGRLEDRKNITTLVRAFGEFAKKDSKTLLVLAGKRGYGYERITSEIALLPQAIARRILMPGYLPQYDTGRYMKYASAFLFPSLYEGFGIPVLEAMACGTFVISSDTPSLKEVGGSATLQLNPLQTQVWSEAMEKAISDPKMKEVYQLESLTRVKDYSWEKSAEATMKVIKNALG